MSHITSIAERLLNRGEWLALAESCTGGLIAKQVTDLAGSSRWFDRGLITYSNRAKQELLGVPEALLKTHGAVSEACAQAMVEGLLRNSPADWGIAVTGIAGPDGGSPEKPVGTVWMAWQRRSSIARVEQHLFRGDRAQVRSAAAEHAIKTLADMLGTTPAM